MTPCHGVDWGSNPHRGANSPPVAGAIVGSENAYLQVGDTRLTCGDCHRLGLGWQAEGRLAAVTILADEHTADTGHADVFPARDHTSWVGATDEAGLGVLV